MGKNKNSLLKKHTSVKILTRDVNPCTYNLYVPLRPKGG